MNKLKITEYKPEGLCLCREKTDQLDPIIDESGFKDTICVVCVRNVRTLKAPRCWMQSMWFMLARYVSAPFLSSLAMFPSE
jgi:hypothetical protein